jgi:hypothetical protein
MLLTDMPIAILSQALLPGSPFKCRTTVPSHKGGLHTSEKLAAYE